MNVAINYRKSRFDFRRDVVRIRGGGLKTMSVLDCRGLACPQPVVTTKQALDRIQSGELVVIVGNAVSCNNVERFAQSQGCSVTVEKKEEDYYLRIRKTGGGGQGEVLREPVPAARIVVYINANLLGVGDEALGSLLMRSFVKTLLDLNPKPNRLILINSGVRLASEGSEILETLKTLSDRGVEVLSCGTCLDFYGLKEKLSVGRVSNMFEIAQSLLEADRVIRP
jgi:selenium metabolism protein YedF